MIKIPSKILSSLLCINVDQLVLNIVCDWSCAEAVHFLCFVQFDLLELQRFCFQRSSYHSFNTLSFWCEYRINHCIESILWSKVSSFFFSWGFIYWQCQNNVWSLVIWLFSQNNRATLHWKLKNYWTKRLQKLPRKCFTFLS